jgi:hypothetical protein
MPGEIRKPFSTPLHIVEQAMTTHQPRSKEWQSCFAACKKEYPVDVYGVQDSDRLAAQAADTIMAEREQEAKR